MKSGRYLNCAMPRRSSSISTDLKPLQRVKHPPALPARADDGHKGTFGRVLVVGGSVGMIGAPVFAGLAALRMGSGLVQLAVSMDVLNACLTLAPELIGLGLNSHDAKPLSDAIDQADVVVLGPGLGRSPGASRLVSRLIRREDQRMVIDADALNALSALPRWPTTFRARAVLTPHPGEMKRLLQLIDGSDVPQDQNGRITVARKASRAFGQIVLLKGHQTVVTDGLRVYINTTGDSSLSKAGTGDVLSGVIGSLLGQGMDAFDAACLGAFLHGLAGERAGRRLGKRSVLARDVIDELPNVLMKYDRHTPSRRQSME